jgi:DNA-binding FadR family transcriptional regulator
MSIFIRKNLSHLVEQELGIAIMCGAFDFCGFPSEANLCKEYGVSRSAVREAVKMLSAKGLISSTPRIGIKILPYENWNLFDPDLLNWFLNGDISIALLKEFLQMRISIEPEAASLATKNANEVQLKAIAEALAQLEATEQHSSEYLDALIDFHTGVLYATNNRFFIRLRDFISTALRSNSANITSPGSYNTGTVADYIKIFNSIKDGNHDRAKHLMMLLIDDSLNHMDFPSS